MKPIAFEQILILGTGTLALKIAQALNQNPYILANHTKILCASYLESSFSFFGSWCKRAKIPYKNFSDTLTLSESLYALEKYTLIISAHNYYLFPLEILQNPHLKIINYHNSLLPLHRGLNAQMWSIFVQDSLSGITWHCVNAEIDCGEIIIQKSIPLNSTHTYLTLTQQQLELGFVAFIEICDSLLHWNLNTKMQDLSCDSKFHKAKDLPNNGYLDLAWDWEQKSAFLRSMDCGKSRILPYPKIILQNKEFEILHYIPNPKNAIGFDLTLGENNG